MENRKLGRPTGSGKFTDELRLRYCDLVAAGARPTAAARVVGISYKTVVRTTRIDPSFAEMVEAAEAVAAEPIEEKLYQMAMGGHFDSIKMWLLNRAKTRWTDTRRTEVEVKGGIALTAGSVDEQIEGIMARLRERNQDDVLDVEPVLDEAIPQPRELMAHSPVQDFCTGTGADPVPLLSDSVELRHDSTRERNSSMG